MKRVFDLFFAILGLIVLFPVFLLFSVIIKITSSGPIFFIQKRVGQNAKVFKMIKFRTMYIVQHSNSTISIKGDTRITRVGRFLRKYKLDELPELLNVVFGDMSLVGPRPDVPGYADKLVGDDRIILKLKPGITGPASLKFVKEEEILFSKKDPKKYNDEVIYPEKVRINVDYYNNRTIWIDIKIIFATIFRIY